MAKGNCKFCNKECKNVGVHEARFCKMNPELNIKELGTPDLKQEAPQEIISEAPQHNAISIRNVQAYIPKLWGTIDMAWFLIDGKYVPKPTEFYGIVDDGKEQVPSLLVVSQNGTILPPFMIEGFIGIFPKDQEFEPLVIEEKVDDSETFPPFPVEEEKIIFEPEMPIVKILPPQGTAPISQPAKAIEAITDSKPDKHTKSIWSSVFGKKDKASIEISPETDNLLKQLNNAKQST